MVTWLCWGTSFFCSDEASKAGSGYTSCTLEARLCVKRPDLGLPFVGSILAINQPKLPDLEKQQQLDRRARKKHGLPVDKSKV